MTLSDLYRKVKGICGCLNSADVPLKCNGNDFNVDFEIKSKDAIVSHIEVKQDLALTWEDMKAIVETADMMVSEANRSPQELIQKYPTEDAYYTEVLNRFNKSKEKR